MQPVNFTTVTKKFNNSCVGLIDGALPTDRQRWTRSALLACPPDCLVG